MKTKPLCVLCLQLAYLVTAIAPKNSTQNSPNVIAPPAPDEGALKKHHRRHESSRAYDADGDTYFVDVPRGRRRRSREDFPQLDDEDDSVIFERASSGDGGSGDGAEPPRSEEPNVTAPTSLSFQLYNPSQLFPEDYNKRQRPQGFTEVSICVMINDIPEVDEHKQEIHLEAWMYLEWHDHRLIIPTEMTHPDQYMFFDGYMLSQLWVPDVRIDHLRSVKEHRLMVDPVQVVIQQNGNVGVWKLVTVSVGCLMDFRNFPFDVQNCRIHMESSAFSTNEMKYLWRVHEMEPLKLLSRIQLENFDFRLVQLNVTKRVYDLNGEYPALAFDIVLRRQLSSYLLTTLLPQMMFVVISWCSFFVPPDIVPGRMTLCITTVLTLSTMFAAVRSGTPTTSYFKAIELYGMVNIFFVFGVLLHYTNILRIMCVRKLEVAKGCSHFTHATQKKTWLVLTGGIMTPRHHPADRAAGESPTASITDVNDKEENGRDGHIEANPHSSPIKDRQQQQNFDIVAARMDNIAKLAFPLTYFLFQLGFWAFYWRSEMESMARHHI